MTDRHVLSMLLERAWKADDKPTARTMAQRTGLAVSTVHSIITGRTVPTEQSLARVLDAMQVDTQLRKNIWEAYAASPKMEQGIAYLVLKDGELHDVIINDRPMALRQAEGEKAVLVQLPIIRDFRERQ